MNRGDYLGAHIDPRETEAFCLRLAQVNEEPLFADARSDLRDFGVGRNVFLWDAEQALWGHTLPADSQARGTCVSRGTYRAAQLSLYWSIAFGGLVGKLVTLAYEPIYGGSRVNVGGGRLSGDGSYGAWAAQYVHDYGLLPRGKFGTIDLTKSNEPLACTWGTRGHGVPQSILRESADYRAAACWCCRTVEDIRDAIAAGYGVAFCSNTLWQVPDGQTTRRDGDGMCRPVDSGGHCEAIVGTYRDHKGRECFVRQQSWGNYPRGTDRIKVYDGREIPLPEGAYGSFVADNDRALRGGGEAWAISAPFSAWRDPHQKPSEVA